MAVDHPRASRITFGTSAPRDVNASHQRVLETIPVNDRSIATLTHATSMTIGIA
jgi:hypothetical protein